MSKEIPPPENSTDTLKAKLAKALAVTKERILDYKDYPEKQKYVVIFAQGEKGNIVIKEDVAYASI